MKVKFTPSGRAQFLAALAHIRRDNPTAAVQLRRRAEKILRRLERYPQSGRAVPEFPELPYREVIVPPNRFFYRVEGEGGLGRLAEILERGRVLYEAPDQRVG